jgi:hypothetical protein
MQRQVDRGPDVINVDDRASEERLLSALRAGDEAVFTELVRTQTPSLIRLARLNLVTSPPPRRSFRRPGSASWTASSGSKYGRR